MKLPFLTDTLAVGNLELGPVTRRSQQVKNAPGAAELAGNRHFLLRFPFIFRHISCNVTFPTRQRGLGSPVSVETVHRGRVFSTCFEVKLIIKEGWLHKLRNP